MYKNRNSLAARNASRRQLLQAGIFGAVGIASAAAVPSVLATTRTKG